MKAIKEILKGVRFKAAGRIDGIKVKGITCYSGGVKPGGMFIAVKGEKIDGAKFIADAVKRGAKAVVCEKEFAAPKDVVKILIDNSRIALPIMAVNFYGHPSKKLETVGITGTNGKTSITYIIENILKSAGKDAGVIGTVNYRFKKKIIPAKNTTPGPIELQSMLSCMVKEAVDCAVMEISSHSLDQHRVDGLLLDAAIFTNITGDHLDYHKTSKNYFNAKKKMLKLVKTKGAAILNNDDRKVASLKRGAGCKVISYGIKNRADVMARDIKLSADGSDFVISMPGRDIDVHTNLIGMHNVSNILAGAAAAFALGIKIDIIKKGIQLPCMIPGRLEAVRAGQPFKVFVDYAHTEDALCNVLGLLREISEGRLITVFGCGGDRDRTKRPFMGVAACMFSDHAIVTSDNPRFEEPLDIIAEIEAGIKDKYSNYNIVPDRRKAIKKALEIASRGDTVIIAGKGHEDYQIVKGRVMHFDDREVAAEVLREIA